MKITTVFILALLIVIGLVFWRFQSLPESDQVTAVMKATGAATRLMTGDPVQLELDRLRKMHGDRPLRQAILSYELGKDPKVGRLLLAIASDQASFSPDLRRLALGILVSPAYPELAGELAKALPEEPDLALREIFAHALLNCGSEGRKLAAQLLEHPEAGVRQAVVTGYAEAAAYDAVESLRPLLQDPVPTVGMAASLALARLGDPTGLPMLQNRLVAPEFGPPERITVLQAFRRLGDPLLVPILASVVENPEQAEEVRTTAVSALGYIRHTEALRHLLGWIETAPTNPRMGQLLPALGRALAELGHPAALTLFLKEDAALIGAEHERVLQEVLRGCSPAPKSYLELLRSTGPRQQSLFSGIHEIVEGLRFYPIDRDGDRRPDLVLEIAPGPPPAILMAIMEHPEVPWKEKDKASKMLRGYSDPDGYRPLLPRLLKLIETCDDRTRFLVVRMLGATRDERALPALIQAAEGKWTRPVTGSIGAIANLGTGAALDALLDFAARHPDQRDDVARVLDAFPLPRTMAYLEKLVAEGEPRLQKTARSSIERLQRDGYLPDPEAALSSPEVRERSLAALALLVDQPNREDARAVLRDCLGCGYAPAESDALRKLRQLEDAQLLPRLIEALKHNRLQSGSLARAYEFLGESGKSETVPFLISGMHEATLDSALEAARIALIRIGHTSSQSDLLAYYHALDLPLPRSAANQLDFKAFLTNPNQVNRGLLLDLLGSNNPHARYFASTALRHLGAPVRDDLTAAAQSENRIRSREAAWLLDILDAQP